MSVDTPTRKPAASRRVGYAIAAVLNTVLLYVINEWPGWDAVPFLTGGQQVVPWINVALVVGVAANLVYLVHPAPWLVAAGGVVTTGLGLAVLIRLWQVFPFDFGGSGWTVAARVVLLLTIAGTFIAVPVQVVALVRAARRS